MFIHSISNLIQLGLHVDSSPTTACIYNLKWTPLQEPEPTLITLAACWFVEVVLTNYQDVYTASLNLLNLLSLITCSVHLRLSLYVLISQNKRYR